MSTKELMNTEQMKGRTIRGYSFNPCQESLLLAFTDGTYIVFGSSEGYDRGETEIRKIGFDTDYFIDEDLVSLGLTTAADLKAERAAKEKEWEDRREQEGRNQYARLKAKYG